MLRGTKKEREERETGKKGKQALETGVHLHIMRRHGRDRILKSVLIDRFVLGIAKNLRPTEPGKAKPL